MFTELQEKVHKRFTEIQQYKLFTIDVPKDILYEAFSSALPEEEKQYHNCNCCKSFLNNYGNIVAINGTEVLYLWDFEIEGMYSKVPTRVKIALECYALESIFVTKEKHLGTQHNFQNKDGKQIKWDHFYGEVLNRHLCTSSKSIESVKGTFNNLRGVYYRSLHEISVNALETVLSLIDQKEEPLYRGLEFRAVVADFLAQKTHFDSLINAAHKQIFSFSSMTPARCIRNTAIGTLLVNLSEGMSIDLAVSKYETIIAPTNYKRRTAIATPAMLEAAKKEVESLGLSAALSRRHATLDDLPKKHLLYLDNEFSQGNVFEALKEEASIDPKKYEDIVEVTIENFISNIVPKSKTISILIQEQHEENFVNLLSAEEKNTPNLFAWDSDISWSYNNNLTDSLKERVKNAGGNVDGLLRFSLQWNSNNTDSSIDLDAHCVDPRVGLIDYHYAGKTRQSSGKLDVDNTCPQNRIAVENIVWTDISKMWEGDYVFRVHNYSTNQCNEGFKAEIVFNGVTHTYTYNNVIPGRAYIDVATVTLSKDKKDFSIKDNLPSKNSANSKYIWGIKTNKFTRINAIMISPNYWESAKGNMHTFFIIDKAINEKPVRSIYNEFLNPALQAHGKAFEMVGNKLLIPPAKEQLAGIGFSSTRTSPVICKVDLENETKIIKLLF